MRNDKNYAILKTVQPKFSPDWGENVGKIMSTWNLGEIYSLEEGVVIIGNDPKEWFDDRESILAFMKAGGSSKMEIIVQNIKACCDGTMEGTMDWVKVRLPNGVEIPICHTRIFHKEDNEWKMVHLHVSVAIPDESMETLYH